MLAPAAFADSTTLTTNVPKKHSISLDVGSGGSVNGLHGTSEIGADRHSKIVFEIKPDSGYKIKSVIYNGEDVTAKISGGKFIIESLESDGSLKVSFARGTIPRTADHSNLLFWSGMLLLSGAGIFLLCKKVRM